MKLLVCFAALLVKIALIKFVKARGNGDCSLTCNAKDFSRPVCGSDGTTYQSKCVLRLKKCTSGKKLYVQYNGSCRDPPSCAEERKRVIKSIKERGLLSVGIFIPDCESDGSYSEIQCSQNKRLCWCVDKYGVEVDDTRVIARRPDCRYRRGNPSSKERYAARILKGCSRDNRASFNKKVMASFKKEMTNLSGQTGKLTSKGIAEWKMSELDANNNGLLNHKELRVLIKKFKRTYSPRKCGKTFFYYCDENHNFAISKSEWLACLDIQETQGWAYNESFPFLVSDTPQCFNQQARARQEQTKNPSSTVFVPSCNKDGTYKPVQCEKVSKYCWCVHPVTGKNIPKTSVQNTRPDCNRSARKIRPTSTPVSRSIKYMTLQRPFPKLSTREVKGTGKKVKECDDVTWRRFRGELVKMFRLELESLTSTRLGGNSTRPRQTRDLISTLSRRLPDTLIAAWKFSQLDLDRDRLIREDELFSSQMKKMFGSIRRGRKCSRKLAASCDVDLNGGLSLDEWRRCL